MMSSTDNETENCNDMTPGESAILEVSTMPVTDVTKQQETRDADFLSNCSTSIEGSVIASPSLDSFSTLPEQEISDFQTDSRDLQVKVDNPQKHLETLETYITFRITTKSTRPEYEEGGFEYVVQRRYNDFIWLWNKLVETYPTHIIPPMPGKHTLLAQLDRYSKEFIIARMKLLHIFLNRVVNHPILSCDKNLFIFLTTKPAEFLVHRKNRVNVLVKMADSLQNIAGTYTKQRPFEFEQDREYCTALSEKLATIDKINHRIHKERQDYLLELHQLHPIFTLWATSEPELTPILLSIAKAIESNAMAQQKLLENVPHEEREYISYIDAVKNALTRRDLMQIEYEMTIDTLTKKRTEKDQLMGISSGAMSTQMHWGGSLWKAESRDEKLEKLGQAIPRLAKRVEVLQDRVECANENLRSDLQRWHIEKKTDLKNMLISMADRQIRHYQHCMTAWEEILTDLKLDGIGSDVNVGAPVKIIL